MSNISFIIIGRNEGSKLSRCLKSVFNTIQCNNMEHSQIIYVDSNSTDDSIIRAKEFVDIKIIKLTGICNAAIARNVGAKYANNKVLLFIDGDMEIIPEFFPLIFKNNTSLIHPFISGQYINYFYNEDQKLISKSDYDKSLTKGDQYKVVTGGLFIIEKSLWENANGMKNKYKMGEDIDFGLRLAKRGTKLLRKKETMALHHTISYRDNKRLWIMLRNKSSLFAKSMLYRDHLFNKYIYPIIIRNDYSLLILIFSLLFSLIAENLLFLGLYPVIILLRSFKAAQRSVIKLINFFCYFLIRDISVLVGFFLFYPPNNNNISYDEIQ